MARKAAPATTKAKTAAKKAAAKTVAKKPAARKTSAKKKPAARKAPGKRAAPASGSTAPRMPDMADFAKMAKMMSPEQAIELYKSNSKLALDVINAAIANTAKLRALQMSGAEQAQGFGRRAAQHAASARTPDAMMAAGQAMSQEAVEAAMRYWGEMFELITEMQKRLFSMMEGQMAGVPGMKETKAAMALMPDLSQAQNVIKAMQGLVSSGGNAFETMQRVMGDLTRMMPGTRR